LQNNLKDVFTFIQTVLYYINNLLIKDLFKMNNKHLEAKLRTELNETLVSLYTLFPNDPKKIASMIHEELGTAAGHAMFVLNSKEDYSIQTKRQLNEVMKDANKD